MYHEDEVEGERWSVKLLAATTSREGESGDRHAYIMQTDCKMTSPPTPSTSLLVLNIIFHIFMKDSRLFLKGKREAALEQIYVYSVLP
jgi:hypothetical protein